MSKKVYYRDLPDSEKKLIKKFINFLGYHLWIERVETTDTDGVVWLDGRYAVMAKPRAWLLAMFPIHVVVVVIGSLVNAFRELVEYYSNFFDTEQVFSFTREVERKEEE